MPILPPQIVILTAIFFVKAEEKPKKWNCKFSMKISLKTSRSTSGIFNFSISFDEAFSMIFFCQCRFETRLSLFPHPKNVRTNDCFNVTHLLATCHPTNSRSPWFELFLSPVWLLGFKSNIWTDSSKPSEKWGFVNFSDFSPGQITPNLINARS